MPVPAQNNYLSLNRSGEFLDSQAQYSYGPTDNNSSGVNDVNFYGEARRSHNLSTIVSQDRMGDDINNEVNQMSGGYVVHTKRHRSKDSSQEKKKKKRAKKSKKKSPRAQDRDYNQYQSLSPIQEKRGKEKTRATRKSKKQQIELRESLKDYPDLRTKAMPAPLNAVTRRNRSNDKRQKMLLAQSLDPAVLRRYLREGERSFKKDEKMYMSTGRSGQDRLMTDDSGLHLPNISSDVDPEFVKQFLTKHNMQYIPPNTKASKNSLPFEPSHRAQLPKAGPRGSPPQGFLSESLISTEDMRASMIQHAIRSQQLQIK